MRKGSRRHVKIVLELEFKLGFKLVCAVRQSLRLLDGFIFGAESRASPDGKLNKDSHCCLSIYPSIHISIFSLSHNPSTYTSIHPYYWSIHHSPNTDCVALNTQCYHEYWIASFAGVFMLNNESQFHPCSGVCEGSRGPRSSLVWANRTCDSHLEDVLRPIQAT